MLKNLLVLAIIGIVANANLFAAALSGKFFVGEQWVPATLEAKDIFLNTDDLGTTIAHGSGEWTLKNSEGQVIHSGNSYFHAPYKSGKGGGIDTSDARRHSKITSTGFGLSIESDELLDVAIYDVSGKCVYTAVCEDNLSIYGNRLNLNNGTYILSSTNQEGVEERTLFMFLNRNFILCGNSIR